MRSKWEKYIKKKESCSEYHWAVARDAVMDRVNEAVKGVARGYLVSEEMLKEHVCRCLYNSGLDYDSDGHWVEKKAYDNDDYDKDGELNEHDSRGSSIKIFT